MEYAALAFGIVCFLAPTFASASTLNASSSVSSSTSTYLQKTALVFELDEGWGDGIIQNQDTVALQRMIANLKAFQGKYEVYALLPAAAANRENLTNILDVLQANGIPFLLEAESSDTIQFNNNAANTPYDASHGFGSSVAELQALKAKYGNEFAGIRFMEVFGENQQIVGCKLFGASWCNKFTNFIPSDNFFEKSLIEPYIAFAHQSGMFVLFGDHFWAANYNPQNDTYDGLPYFSSTATVTPSIFNSTIKQPQNEKDIQALAAAYPGTIVALYDNNDGAGGVDDSAAKIGTWESQIIKPFISTGGFKGFGLSDQSWLCSEYYSSDGSACPVSGIVSWAQQALAAGATVIETEPYWFWFNMPAGSIPVYNYTTDPQWANRGYATSNLQALATALGVTLPASTLIQIPAHQLDRFVITPTVSCISTSTTSNVIQVTWPYALPTNSYFNIEDSQTGANGYYNLNVTGLLGANGPNGMTKSGTVANMPAHLTIQPGKTYYVVMYDGALNYGTQPKAFSIPQCTGPQSSNQLLNTYTVASSVSCLASTTTTSVVSVQVPYTMPQNSVLSISDSASYVNGYYSKSIAGLSVEAGPFGFLPSNTVSNMSSALSIVPGKTYYTTLYDPTLNYGPVKSFSIPQCSTSTSSGTTTPPTTCPLGYTPQNNQCVVTAPPQPTPSGSLSATPNPCPVGSNGLCTVTLTWQSSTSTPTNEIWVSQSTGTTAFKLVACQGTGKAFTESVPWIQKGIQYRFNLYQTPNCQSTLPTGNPLQSVIVTGAAPTTASSTTASQSDMLSQLASVAAAVQSILKALQSW
jgi:hypothetical protein